MSGVPVLRFHSPLLMGNAAEWGGVSEPSSGSWRAPCGSVSLGDVQDYFDYRVGLAMLRRVQGRRRRSARAAVTLTACPAFIVPTFKR